MEAHCVAGGRSWRFVSSRKQGCASSEAEHCRIDSLRGRPRGTLDQLCLGGWWQPHTDVGGTSTPSGGGDQGSPGRNRQSIDCLSLWPSDSADRVSRHLLRLYITTGSMFTWLIGFWIYIFYIRFYQVYMSGSVCSLEHLVWTIYSLVIFLLIQLSIHFRTYIVHCIGLFIYCTYVSHAT